MIEGESPVIQALLGTLFTWALTLAGAAMALFLQVICQEVKVVSFWEFEGVFRRSHKKLDISLLQS